MRFHKIAKRTNLSPKPKESVSTALFWSYSSSIICSISGTGLIFSVSWVICTAPFKAFFHLVTCLGHSQDKTSVNQIPYCNSKGWVCTNKQRWGVRQTAFGVVKIQSVLTSDKPSHLDTNNKNQHKSALPPKEKVLFCYCTCCFQISQCLSTSPAKVFAHLHDDLNPQEREGSTE